MQRGLGSCVAALKNMQDAEKANYLPLVLRGCSRDMAFDAQCEGCRSVYRHKRLEVFLPAAGSFSRTVSFWRILCRMESGGLGRY